MVHNTSLQLKRLNAWHEARPSPEKRARIRKLRVVPADLIAALERVTWDPLACWAATLQRRYFRRETHWPRLLLRCQKLHPSQRP